MYIQSDHASVSGAFPLDSRVGITKSHRAGTQGGGVGLARILDLPVSRPFRNHHTGYAGASVPQPSLEPLPNSRPLPAKALREKRHVNQG